MTRIVGFALIVAGISLLLCVVLSLWKSLIEIAGEVFARKRLIPLCIGCIFIIAGLILT